MLERGKLRVITKYGIIEVDSLIKKEDLVEVWNNNLFWQNGETIDLKPKKEHYNFQSLTFENISSPPSNN